MEQEIERTVSIDIESLRGQARPIIADTQVARDVLETTRPVTDQQDVVVRRHHVQVRAPIPIEIIGKNIRDMDSRQYLFDESESTGAQIHGDLEATVGLDHEFVGQVVTGEFQKAEPLEIGLLGQDGQKAREKQGVHV
jgi:hypothetical protein